MRQSRLRSLFFSTVVCLFMRNYIAFRIEVASNNVHPRHRSLKLDASSYDIDSTYAKLVDILQQRNLVPTPTNSFQLFDVKNLGLSWKFPFEQFVEKISLYNVDFNYESIINEPLLPYIFATLSIFLLSFAIKAVQSSGDDIIELKTYDIKSSEEFYNQKPFLVFQRLFKLATITSAFNIKLLLDWKFDNIEKNQKERAKEALALVNQLGPTFIKLGQALSIRTDLIPEAYALELRQLQDAVPQFDSEIAKEIIRNELGITKLDELFRYISEKPVASASIGQVYKGILQDGREVAVKVQRPKVLNEIILDLYLLRLLAPYQVKLSNAIRKRKTEQADIDVAINLIDEWGRGFVAEVDYRLEAYNQKQFIDAMSKRGLFAVTAPAIIDAYSGPRVLVSEWVNGTRLDRDASSDVPRLCGVAVHAYLTMLLDTGVLHCDPHPGNLLRTVDGKLCVLDWGMTLRVPPDLQYGLIDFIAHVNIEDYDSLPEDFVKIGFTPPDKLEEIKRSGLSKGLAFGLRQLGKGGGPSKIRERVGEELKERYGGNLTDDELRLKVREEMISNMETQLKEEGVDVNGVTNIMEEMSRRNREMFKLPPYVLYVTRAFSILEGIGLSVDENFSILSESYPYLAKRLMTDNSPRAKQALRAMLFEKSSGGMLSTSKLAEMVEGFASYTASTVSADRDVEGSRVAKEALSGLLLAKEGNFVQDLVLEGAARVGDSLAREVFTVVRHSPAGTLVKSALKLPWSLAQSQVPMQLRALAFPLTLPYDVSEAMEYLFAKDDSDELAITSARQLATLVQAKGSEALSKGIANRNTAGLTPTKTATTTSTSTSADSAIVSAVQDQLQALVSNPSQLAQQLPVAGAISLRLGASILQRIADRLESRLTDNSNLASAALGGDADSHASTSRGYNRDVVSRVGSVSLNVVRTLEKIIDLGNKSNTANK